MAARCNEQSRLLMSTERQDDNTTRRKVSFAVLLGVAVAAAIVGGNSFSLSVGSSASPEAKVYRYQATLEKIQGKNELHGHQNQGFRPSTRCEFVQEKMDEKNVDKSEDELRSTYTTQATDYNVFYRATAHIFWNDFVTNGWANMSLASLKLPTKALNPKSTWTWVTGDQHLSNFGAWRNRNNEVVFSVNDFDEAAIYDFHVDVLRIAVSIYNHAITNGLNQKQIDKAMRIFTNGYVTTVVKYVGNEDALLFELTPDTAHGALKEFLQNVEEKTANGQLQKFTNVDNNGVRHFIKGPINTPDNDTSLAAVPPRVKDKIRAAFSPTHYGATMMKLGWHVKQWDGDYFEVLDVAERVGSGVGSLGVDRFYVLLKGTDGLLGEDGEDGAAVILDVKEQPLAAVERVLSANDAAWYTVMFSNAAARVVEAQRRLTSFVDPFTGWLLLKDEDTSLLAPFNVRQRSPWKDSIDLDKLTDPDDFNDFIAQIAVATATSHVRGTVAKAPAQFKHVIYSMFKEKKANKKQWGENISELAKAYHNQVLLDYACFRAYVHDSFGGNESAL